MNNRYEMNLADEMVLTSLGLLVNYSRLDTTHGEKEAGRGDDVKKERRTATTHTGIYFHTAATPD